MRFALYAWVVALLALGLWGQAAPQDLGHVIFIGDSITHGVGAASYRWPLHKILVDNGVSFEVVGVAEGNRFAEQGIAPGTTYRGVSFNNRHCSITSERAYEISGRKHPSQRLGASDIHDWLGLDTTYRGPYKLPAGPPPDTCFILIGTNDILGDYDGSFDRPENLRTLKHALLDDATGDMSTIVAALRRANPQMRIIVLSIPTWEYHVKNNTASAYAAVRSYNQALAAWAEQAGVLYVDVYSPLVDAACEEMPGKGVADFFYPEEGLHLHPSTQGDLLMAGAIARALGYHGRTAGLPTPEAVPPPSAAPQSLTLAPGQGAELPMPGSRSAAPDFTLRTFRVGNGAAGGWDCGQGLRLRFGDSARTGGDLLITESYITWAPTGAVLYSADMSAPHGPLRIAWVEGDPAQNIPSGYYIWLAGQLIGEALPPAPATPSTTAHTHKILLQNTATTPAQLSL